MTLTSRIMGRLAKLPPRRDGGQVAVDRDLEVPMPDSAVLLADRWYPVGDGERPPVVVLRSPYGRRQLGLVGRLFAERGYQVLIQSTRGSFGSAGAWVPFFNEQEDGQATHKWLAEQPWFGGVSGTWGPSYLGLTQWAVAGDPPEHLKAMAPSVTASNFRDAATYPGGSFSLETGATWIHQLEVQEQSLPRMLFAHLRSTRHLDAVYRVLPLSRADWAGVRRSISFYQDWLVHEQPGDPWWHPVDFGRDLGRVPPMSLVGGWFDIFLPDQVADFEALVRAGRTARLTIGPWTHTSPKAGGEQLRDALDWFDEHLLARKPRRPHLGVRIHVMGDDRWVDLRSWPPPATVSRWHLQGGAGLSPAPPAGAPPDRFRYDPLEPTPSLGGPSLNFRTSGPRDQAERERRADVLCYTTESLTAPLTIAGPLRAEIWLRSSAPSTDVSTRLCVVDAEGVSTNVADGILRLQPGDGEPDGAGTMRADVAMWPTAVTVKAGERLRLQVAAGAHPLFARNPGTGERLGAAKRTVVADIEVLHDPDHPSGIDLPVSTI
jgi:putative CocE/NonD family hydrolase